MISPTSVVFTICSINYLAQAVTLGNSLKDSNPKLAFRIYLVDKLLDREDIIERVPFPIIEIENVPVIDFKGMCIRYNLTELNTSIKPFIIDYIFKNEEQVEKVIYFDPDIMVLGNLEELSLNLNNNTIVLTPHILSPSEEHPYGQRESNYLLAGIFNLGFIGVSRQTETSKFLTWWQDRLIHQGYANNAMHLFYDQKWLNLAIIFFQKVFIEKSPGYNMAGWNLHEREVTDKVKDGYIVNHNHKLIFFHFSGVKALANNISTYSLYTMEDRPDLAEIINKYRSNLISNGNDFFSLFECYYSQYYKGMIIYYPKYHWITLYRRSRFHLGRFRRTLLKTLISKQP